ncbi:MAG TPA: hypothetical protein VFT43_07120 [Candidatus Polarisedimenticolia bacterium]|nr:hypothetical protein [Candidatus Polarisedimenticolia bacterium]
MNDRHRALLTAGPDPGEDWAFELLRPLRRRAIDCDVAPAVMARIGAARLAAPATSASFEPFERGWTAWFMPGLAMFAVLVGIACLAARSGQGAREAWGVTLSLGHLIVLLGHGLVAAGGYALTVAAPIARATWARLEILAPLVRGAGLAAAVCGLMSIITSLYIFTHARAVAPAGGAGGRIHLQGGPR